MKHGFLRIALGFLITLGSASLAQTINVHGKVSNPSGQPVKNALVELVRNGLKDTTASDGLYALSGFNSVVRPNPRSGGISLIHGLVQCVLTRNSSVTVEAFDLHGNRLLKKTMDDAAPGVYRWNLAVQGFSDRMILLKVSVGSDVRKFRYLPMRSRASSLNPTPERTAAGITSLAKTAAAVDTLKVSAAGYITQRLPIGTFDTTADVTLDTLPANGLALMKWADIEAKFTGGMFRLPAASEVPAGGEFIYSGGVHAQLANGHLIVSGKNHIPPDNSEIQGEIQLPTALDGGAAQCLKWTDVTDSLLPAGWVPGSETDVLGGLLEIGSRLYFTKYQWYNGGGTDWGSLGYRDESAGKAYGMWQVSGSWTHNQRVAGYMTYPPKALGDAGYLFLAGQQGTSGSANGRWGPNLFAIQGAFPTSSKDSVASKPLLAHPDQSREYPGWWLGDKVSSAVWIETKTQHAVLFFVYQQLGGQTWYGENVDTCTCTDCDPPITACGTALSDPYPTYKGFHAVGYHLQAWIYDPNALLAVLNGKRDPWSVLPAEKVDLITRAPGTKSETIKSFIKGNAMQQLQASYRNGRLIILQPDAYVPGQYESEPKGYVIQLE